MLDYNDVIDSVIIRKDDLESMIDSMTTLAHISRIAMTKRKSIENSIKHKLIDEGADVFLKIDWAAINRHHMSLNK